MQWLQTQVSSLTVSSEREKKELPRNWPTIYNDMLHHFRRASESPSSYLLAETPAYAEAWMQVHSKRPFIGPSSVNVPLSKDADAYVALDVTITLDVDHNPKVVHPFAETASPSNVIWLGCEVGWIQCARTNDCVPEVFSVQVPTEPLLHRQAVRVFETKRNVSEKMGHIFNSLCAANYYPTHVEVAFLTLLHTATNDPAEMYPDVALQTLVTKVPNVQQQASCLHLVAPDLIVPILVKEGFDGINH